MVEFHGFSGWGQVQSLGILRLGRSLLLVCNIWVGGGAKWMLPAEFPFQQRGSTSEDQGVASLQRPGGMGRTSHTLWLPKKDVGECFFPNAYSEGSRFTLEVWGLRVCSLDVAQPFAIVRNRSRATVWGPYDRAYGKFCKRGRFWRFPASRCFVSHGMCGTWWHPDVFRNVSKDFLCGKRNAFATFSEDEFLSPHFTLYTPHFRLHFTLHTLHFTLYTLHSALYTLHSTL
jgi:hypothetical protein